MLKKLQAERLFSKGQKLKRQGKIDESIRIFDQALSLAPNYSGIYLHKAISLSEKKQYTGAIEELKKAIEFNPSNAVYHQFIGRAYYDCKKFDYALNAFEESLKRSSDNALTLCFKNLALLAKGERISEAHDILKRNISNTNSEFLGRFLVHCESFLHQNREMARPLEKCLIIRGRTLKIFRSQSFANILRHLKKLFFHLMYYSCNIYYCLIYFYNKDKKNAYHCYMKAIQNNFLGKPDDAIIEYKRALEYFPGLTDVKEILFEHYLTRGEYGSAWKYLKQLPEYKEIWYLSSTHSRKYKEERRQKDKIERKLRSNQSLISDFGRIYYHMGKYGKAIERLRIALEYDSNDYYPFYCLGLCHIAKNDHEEAYVWFHRAMECLNPNVAERRLHEMIRIFKTNTHGSPSHHEL